MNKPGRKQQPDSRKGRLREWFLNNPEEELTPDDIAQKFDIPKAKVWTLVRMLKADGICEAAYVFRAKRN